MCPIYTNQEERNWIPDTKHTNMRARVLADHRDVGLLRNTGIDPLPTPPTPDNSKSCPTSILPSASETPGPLPLKQQSGSAYAIILTLQFVNGCSLFFKISAACCALRNVLTPQRLEVLCSSHPSKMLYVNVNFSKWLT